MSFQEGLFAEEVHAALQIERELETEDLMLLSQLRRASRRPGKKPEQKASPTLPYVARPSLTKPGATIATGR